MTADYRSAARQRADGSWENSFCRLCMHQVMDRTHTVQGIDRCSHVKVLGRSTDKPTCYTARMSGSPCGPGGKLWEGRA